MLTISTVLVTMTVSVTRSVVGGGVTKTVWTDVLAGAVSTTVTVTVAALPGPEPEPEPDPDPPEPPVPSPPDPPAPVPPSMGTTEYVALGARACGWAARCSWTGRPRHVAANRGMTENRDAARPRCILKSDPGDAGQRIPGASARCRVGQ